MVALVPVLAFLCCLLLLDSFRLLTPSRVGGCILVGAASAGICYFVNGFALQLLGAAWGEVYARFGGPLVEELAKAVFLFYLVWANRVAFGVDAGICGFAVGAGFALAENVFYLQQFREESLGLWILRGVGTATMHGGTTAVAGIVSITLAGTRESRGLNVFLPGLLTAFAIHSFFNQGLLPPVATTVLMVAGLPALLALIFLRSERTLSDWLGQKLDRDIELLNSMRNGELPRTRAGAYLQSLRGAFAPEILGDMLCLLQLSLELSARAKGTLLLREAGFEPPPDPGLQSHLEELDYLEKSIGRAGLLAMGPLLARGRWDLWELRRLAGGT